MAAFNVVRVRVKPEHEHAFIEHSRNIAPEKLDRLRQNGLLRLIAVKTGERSYCLLGEWASFEAIVQSRPDLIGELDRTREMLEDLGGELGLTDPVSGEVVMELGGPAPAGRSRAPRPSARKGGAAKPRASAKKPAARAKKAPARGTKRPAARAAKPAAGKRAAGKAAGTAKRSGAKRGKTARR